MALIFVAALAVYQILLIFVHAAVYKTMVAAFGWDSTWLAWLFGILSISFVTSSILAHEFRNRIVVWYYRISAYWFGLIHFLFIGAFGFYIVATALYRSGYYIPPALIGGIAFVAMFLVHLYATWQTGRPKVARIEVALPHLPEFWRGKKVLFFSDLHIGAIWDGGLISKVISIIQVEEPESVWIGGDMFDGVKCHSEKSLKPLSTLHLPHGIYFITGNHEYIRDTKDFVAAIRANGIHILNNEVVDLRGLQLAGVDWKDTRTADEYKKILNQMPIDRSKPSVLLRHEPNYLPIAEAHGFSLHLSGHTHRGQIWPLSVITRRVFRGFDYGLKQFQTMMVCTSSGVGTWGPPLRFGTKSEVVVITFQ